jgi:hypothetical protein
MNEITMWYLITFFSQFTAVHFRIQKNYGALTQGGRTGPTTIYIHTERMGKILKNIFEINYNRCYCKDIFLDLEITIFSDDIQRYVSNDQAYDNLFDKKDR